ncbi:MAG TPA: hypothetical protein VHQ90_00870 [Thermoanaerobaculia bacterium]|nr:hypothetical protein [Thermoanaerobaculia bacterium]
MKHNVILTVTSLLSILLSSIHVTDDIVRGISPAGPQNVFGVLILAVWLYGTLVLADRRSGHVIMLLGALFAAAMPVLHMRGASYGGGIAKSSGAFWFIWTLFALGATGSLSAILAARGLRSRPLRQPADQGS